MIDQLRSILADLIVAPAQRELVKRIGRCESRMALIVKDLDCDIEGSLAAELELVRIELHDLRARVDDWLPTAAEAAKPEESR